MLNMLCYSVDPYSVSSAMLQISTKPNSTHAQKYFMLDYSLNGNAKVKSIRKYHR